MRFLFLCLSFAASLPAFARESVAVDIYNRDQALVREVRRIDLQEGHNRIEFDRIAEGIFGYTARVKPLGSPKRITELSLALDYDLASLEKLLTKYIGEWFSFTADEEVYQGRLLRYDENHLFLQPDTTDPLLQVVERGKLKEMYFPALPGGLVTQPVLVWELIADRALRGETVEISYLTSDIYWTCDYRLELTAPGEASLDARFTLDNQLPLDFPNAKVTLIAGEVHRSGDPAGSGGASTPASGGSDGQRFFEYHRYPLERAVDLTGSRTLLRSYFTDKRIKVERRFVLPHVLDEGGVRAMVRLVNARENGLGAALPAGDVGLFERTAGGELAFIGEDRLSHLPAGARADLTVGVAFDLSARRTRLAQSRPQSNRHEEKWRVEISSARPELTLVEVEHRVYGFYDISAATSDGKVVTPRADETNKVFLPVQVPASGKVTLEYTIGYGL